jgi:hypothetical protein
MAGSLPRGFPRWLSRSGRIEAEDRPSARERFVHDRASSLSQIGEEAIDFGGCRHAAALGLIERFALVVSHVRPPFHETSYASDPLGPLDLLDLL